MIRRAAVVAAAFVLSVTSACTAPGLPSADPGSPASTAPGETVDLTVFAAASLRGALAEIARVYPTLSPGTTLTVTTDSSTALATQIELGAPSDVFLSADTDNPRRLVAGRHADAPPVPFATNPVVIVVAEGNPLGIQGPRDLARPGLRVIAAGPDVPISRYAAQLIEQLARLPDSPPEFAAAYEANIVSREDNVGAVIAKMELGVADAAIVYGSDVTQSPVETLPMPDGVTVRATYEGVVLRSSRHRKAAATFLEWLTGPVGQDLLADSGFDPP